MKGLTIIFVSFLFILSINFTVVSIFSLKKQNKILGIQKNILANQYKILANQYKKEL